LCSATANPLSVSQHIRVSIERLQHALFQHSSSNNNNNNNSVSEISALIRTGGHN